MTSADVIHGDALDVLRTMAPGSVDAAVKPLCIDLFCGLGGWTEGFLAEGWKVVGFDIERHVYGGRRYPAQLVLQDVRTIHGSQFRDADMIVASSPCQEFSYRAMPWKRAKALGPPLLGMELFAQAARIQREASDAAGRHIPMVQENVRGAQKYVGRAQWHYGSYYLWGDVPVLMPMTVKAQKFNPDGTAHGTGSWFAIADSKNRGASEGVKVASDEGCRTDVGKGARFTSRDCGVEGTKNTGGSWFNIGSPGQKVTNQNPVHGGRVNRKVASARIAKIPAPLARYVAQVYVTIARRRIAEAQAQGRLFEPADAR